MRFIEIILENSKAKEARLYNAAKKAYQNPEIGITIQNKAAYHVIKDCAGLTVRYLAHFAFGSYVDPFTDLKGKFTRAEIQNFITVSESDFVLKQLLDVILAKGNSQLNSKTPEVRNEGRNETNDPYGEYGTGYDEAPIRSITPITDTLCDLFDAK